MNTMNQNEILLASLAASRGEPYQPVQIQKLIFLFQEKALKEKIFNFTPYDYGPFDSKIYIELEELAQVGSVEIIGQPFSKLRLYGLTPKGEKSAKEALDKLSSREQEFLIRLSTWVKSLPFAQLVGAIYKEYPAMRENSVFRG